MSVHLFCKAIVSFISSGSRAVQFDTIISCARRLRDFQGGCSSRAPISSNFYSDNTWRRNFGFLSIDTPDVLSLIGDVLNSVSVGNSNPKKFSSGYPLTLRCGVALHNRLIHNTLRSTVKPLISYTKEIFRAEVIYWEVDSLYTVRRRTSPDSF
jgi:hypothetical protein